MNIMCRHVCSYIVLLALFIMLVRLSTIFSSGAYNVLATKCNGNDPMKIRQLTNYMFLAMTSEDQEMGEQAMNISQIEIWNINLFIQQTQGGSDFKCLHNFSQIGIQNVNLFIQAAYFSRKRNFSDETNFNKKNETKIIWNLYILRSRYDAILTANLFVCLLS